MDSALLPMIRSGQGASVVGIDSIPYGLRPHVVRHSLPIRVGENATLAEHL